MKADAILVSGALAVDAAVRTVQSIREATQAIAHEHERRPHGFVTLRLSVDAHGGVTAIRSLCDRILPLSPDTSRYEPFLKNIFGLLAALRFPECPAASEVTTPIIVGTP